MKLTKSLHWFSWSIQWLGLPAQTLLCIIPQRSHSIYKSTCKVQHLRLYIHCTYIQQHIGVALCMNVHLNACAHVREYVCVKVNKCLFFLPHCLVRPSMAFAKRHSPHEAPETTVEKLTVGTVEGSWKSHCFLLAQYSLRGRGSMMVEVMCSIS